MLYPDIPARALVSVVSVGTVERGAEALSGGVAAVTVAAFGRLGQQDGSMACAGLIHGQRPTGKVCRTLSSRHVNRRLPFCRPRRRISSGRSVLFVSVWPNSRARRNEPGPQRQARAWCQAGVWWRSRLWPRPRYRVSVGEPQRCSYQKWLSLGKYCRTAFGAHITIDWGGERLSGAARDKATGTGVSISAATERYGCFPDVRRGS